MQNIQSNPTIHQKFIEIAETGIKASNLSDLVLLIDDYLIQFDKSKKSNYESQFSQTFKAITQLISVCFFPSKLLFRVF